MGRGCHGLAGVRGPAFGGAGLRPLQAHVGSAASSGGVGACAGPGLPPPPPLWSCGFGVRWRGSVDPGLSWRYSQQDAGVLGAGGGWAAEEDRCVCGHVPWTPLVSSLHRSQTGQDCPGRPSCASPAQGVPALPEASTCPADVRRGRRSAVCSLRASLCLTGLATLSLSHGQS